MLDRTYQNYIDMPETDYDGQDIFFAETLEQQEQIARELCAEERAWNEIQMPVQEPEVTDDASVSDGPFQRKKLKRDLRKEALNRLEEAARTEADFENVISWWDRLDANRERRERYHEVLRSGDILPLDEGAAQNGAVFPASLNMVLNRQIREGEFNDAIHYCPYEVQELATEDYLYRTLNELSDDRKQLLFLRAVEKMSAVKIAEIREQSDRNIRKVWVTLKNHLRKQCAEELTARKERGQSLTLDELQFLQEYTGSDLTNDKSPHIVISKVISFCNFRLRNRVGAQKL